MNSITKMEPIVLNKFGDTLLEYPRTCYETCCKLSEVEKQPDKGKLSTCIGLHDICHGWIDIKDISKTHRRIMCRACGFTLTIPLKIQTYGDLRKWSKCQL